MRRVPGSRVAAPGPGAWRRCRCACDATAARTVPASPASSCGRVLGRRRSLLLAVLASTVLAACGTASPRTQFDSQFSFDRTFNMVMAAMSDQKLTFSVQDRRQGLLVGELNGDVVQATLQPNFLDSTVRVQFSTFGTPADEQLLMRVVDAYRQRVSGQANILPQRTP